MKRELMFNIAPAREPETPLVLPFIVKLRGYGNPDFGQDPGKMVCRPSEAIVGDLRDGQAAVLFYIGVCQLGGGNWVKDAGEVTDEAGAYIGRFSYNGRFWPVDHAEGYGAPRELAMPDGLSEDGKKAYLTIVKILAREGLVTTGGCRPFYTPEEWRAKKIKYGENSLLVIVHDGGSLSPVFGEFQPPYNEIQNALAKQKMYVEGCTATHSAVYPIIPIKVPK